MKKKNLQEELRCASHTKPELGNIPVQKRERNWKTAGPASAKCRPAAHARRVRTRTARTARMRTMRGAGTHGRGF